MIIVADVKDIKELVQLFQQVIDPVSSVLNEGNDDETQIIKALLRDFVKQQRQAYEKAQTSVSFNRRNAEIGRELQELEKQYKLAKQIYNRWYGM